MRSLFLILTVLFLCLPSCDKGSTDPPGTYEYLRFVRNGGGDKIFTVEPSTKSNSVDIAVSRYAFRDTSMQFQCGCGFELADAFAALNAALKGQCSIAGSYHQSTLPTGTWARLILVRNREEIEITNVELRNRLMPFEKAVEQLVQHGSPNAIYGTAPSVRREVEGKEHNGS
ncbi:MAG: hypothetical protein WB699_17480 [Bacteroidota bacterium]